MATLVKTTENNEVVVDPDAKLEEELIIRPTSETIIWKSYKNWIQSYRDLPLLINQWANVMRWEMRTRAFLRTSEFLWQEGHTAHATKEEAIKETLQMLEIYYEMGQNLLAIPFVKGVKTENEKFAGSEDTYTIEAIMQDGKALQCGTSHFLGQNFAKAFDVKFANRSGELEYVWGTSWGVTTRLIGAVIMTHSDDEGLVLPPNIAPIQVVLIPIYRSEEEKKLVCEYTIELKEKLLKENIRVKLDDSDSETPGWKYAEYELKGVPLRIAVGPRDLKNNCVEIYRRDTKEKSTISSENIVETIQDLIFQIQKNIYNKALLMQQSHIHEVETYADFKEVLNDKKGFILAHWDGTTQTEELINQETKATIRCIPFSLGNDSPGKCIVTGKPSKRKVLFAQAY